MDKAIDDMIACKIFGRQLQNNGTIAFLKLGIHVETFPSTIEIAGSLEHPLTEAQLQRLLEVFVDTKGKEIPIRITIEQARRLERFRCLAMVMRLAYASSSERRKIFKEHPIFAERTLSFPESCFLRLDWNKVMKRANKTFDNPRLLETRWMFGETFWDKLHPNLRAEQFADFVRFEMLESYVGPLSVQDPLFQSDFEKIDRLEKMQAIVLAMLVYEKHHSHLPPAWTADKQEKPLHSWRVLLLPYLGQKELYDKIRLDEPWDSNYNRQFHDIVIPPYQYRYTDQKPGETRYSVIVGKKTAFRGSQGVPLREFDAKKANLALILERQTPVCWMDPTSEVAETRIRSEIPERSSFFGLRNGTVVNIGKYELSGPYTYIPSQNGLGESKPIAPSNLQRLIEGIAKRFWDEENAEEK